MAKRAKSIQEEYAPRARSAVTASWILAAVTLAVVAVCFYYGRSAVEGYYFARVHSSFINDLENGVHSRDIAKNPHYEALLPLKERSTRKALKLYQLIYDEDYEKAQYQVQASGLPAMEEVERIGVLLQELVQADTLQVETPPKRKPQSETEKIKALAAAMRGGSAEEEGQAEAEASETAEELPSATIEDELFYVAQQMMIKLGTPNISTNVSNTYEQIRPLARKLGKELPELPEVNSL